MSAEQPGPTQNPTGHIRLERRQGAGWLEIDRVSKGNSWLLEMWFEATKALADCAADPEVRAVVIRSAGGAIFSGGADLEELSEMTARPDAAKAIDRHLSAVEGFLDSIEKLEKPVIAAIDGAAMGAGLEIAAACDLRWASSRSSFGIPAARHGIVIARADVARLARTVGWSFATELLLTARVVDSEEALAKGLVGRILDGSQLDAAVEQLVAQIVELVPRSIAAQKRHLHEVWPIEVDDSGFADTAASLASLELRSALAARRSARASAKGAR